MKKITISLSLACVTCALVFASFSTTTDNSSDLLQNNIEAQSAKGFNSVCEGGVPFECGLGGSQMYHGFWLHL